MRVAYEWNVYDRIVAVRTTHMSEVLASWSIAERAELADGDVIDLVSIWSDGERWAKGFRAVAYPTPRGCAAAYFPEASLGLSSVIGRP